LGPAPAKTKIFSVAAISSLRELRSSGGSVLGLLDCAEDRRRGALDWPAQEVLWAVAVQYLGEPLVGAGTGLPSGLVVMSQ